MGNSVKPFREESWTIKTTRTTKRKVIRQRPAGKTINRSSNRRLGCIWQVLNYSKRDGSQKMRPHVLLDGSRTECFLRFSLHFSLTLLSRKVYEIDRNIPDKLFRSMTSVLNSRLENMAMSKISLSKWFVSWCEVTFRFCKWPT